MVQKFFCNCVELIPTLFNSFFLLFVQIKNITVFGFSISAQSKHLSLSFWFVLQLNRYNRHTRMAMVDMQLDVECCLYTHSSVVAVHSLGYLLEDYLTQEVRLSCKQSWVSNYNWAELNEGSGALYTRYCETAINLGRLIWYRSVAYTPLLYSYLHKTETKT